MDRNVISGVRRPELHINASRAAQALRNHFPGEQPIDVRSVLAYWSGAESALERAAQHVIDYATALGIRLSAEDGGAR